MAFKTLSKMLPEETQATFDFAAQEGLHEEIIDGGLKSIYSDHLESARKLTSAEGVEIETKLMAGKPYGAILKRVEERGAFMLALGRTGFQADAGLDIGSNAENALRNAPCHVLLSAKRAFALPKATDKTLAGPTWTIQALELLDRIPAFAREMAKRLVEKHAVEAGVETITDEYMRAVREELGMPDVLLSAGTPPTRGGLGIFLSAQAGGGLIKSCNLRQLKPLHDWEHARPERTWKG